MAVTNLTDTSWRIKEGFSASAGFGTFTVNHLINTIKYNFLCVGIRPDYGNSYIEDIIYSVSSEYSGTIFLQVKANDVVTFTSGKDVTNTNLISWLEKNAILLKESIKLNCSVDYDEYWEPQDCHWDIKRFFKITFKITDGDIRYNANAKHDYAALSYRLTDYNTTHSDSAADYTAINKVATYYKVLQDNQGKNTYIWTYYVNFNNLDFAGLRNKEGSEGFVTLTAYLRAQDEAGTWHTAYSTFDYLVELPPEPVNEIHTELVVSAPGKVRCFWDKAKLFGENDGKECDSIDSVDGYCIEIFKCSEGADQTIPANFTQIKGLYWSESDLNTETAEGTYTLKLAKSTDSTKSFIGFNGINSDGTPKKEYLIASAETYIENPLDRTKTNTEFYFVPEDLGILPGETYKIVVYPYSHYEGALIASGETGQGSGEVSKGIVRVYTGDTWVEGLVYVMTDKGWQKADSIYVMTDKGWQETT